MNKKFSTLVTAAMLVTSVNGWAQTQVDEAIWPAGAPFVAPYAVKIDNGAKPIEKLKNVGAAESRYFQFIVSDVKATNVPLVEGEAKEGKIALTMVWKAATLEKAGHYELALEDLTNVQDEVVDPSDREDPARVRLERSLWEVRAKRYPNSPVLYYTLINKASQLPLQLSKTNFEDGNGSIEIVNGSTDWLWADGAVATKASAIDDDAELVLQNMIRAAISNTEMIYLVEDENGDVQVVKQNSNEEAPDGAITFEGWEANPIVLTAAQINSELGYEDVLTQNKGKKDSFKFTFEPDVEGLDAVNKMTEGAFFAIDLAATEGASGYVKFQSKTDKAKYLMVDTAYYDAEINAKYDLQMAVKTVEAPKYAIVADEKEENAEDEGFAAKAIAQLARQTHFKPIFYPSTQSLRLQAEMIFKADKEKLAKPSADKPYEYAWWGQMAYAIGEDNEMEIVNADDATLYWDGNYGYFEPFTDEDTELLEWVDGENKAQWNQPATSVEDLTYTDWFGTSAEGGDPSAPEFASLALNNVVKLTTLTNSPKHTVVTCDVRDEYDARNEDGHSGLLTYISLEGLMPIYTEVAEIPTGFYYMQNANEVNTNLLKNGEYRYEDLAATAATYAYWDALNEKHAVGKTASAGFLGTIMDIVTGQEVVNNGENGDARTAANGNVVYSADLKEIPSAQWYFDGNGGYYTITNRESARNWGTSYWWKLKGSNDTYVNHNTYLNGTGLTGGLESFHRDTVKLIQVTATALKDIHSGYLNLSAEEAEADTCVFAFKFNTVGSEDLYLGQQDGVLKVMKENPGRYKLERVVDESEKMIDKYDASTHFVDSLVYGLNPSGKKETQLARAMYYIYKDEVSSISSEGVYTREYVTLDGGKYILNKINLKTGESYDPKLNSGKIDPRKYFYVKRISTVDPDQFVLVDPKSVGRELNVNGDYAQGVRVFVNQQSAELQPAGLASQAAANVFDNSVFTIEKVQGYNYRDIRTEGNVRDTLEFYKESNPNISLYENTMVKDANVGLLDRVNNSQVQKNYALFVDTANVANTEKPMFLLGLRPVDSYETSNIPDHNIHLSTTADYLVNLVDSAKAGNNVYKYTNVSQNIERTYYRLGFVNAVHKGSSLFITNDDNKEIALNEGLTKASFAFRYVDTDRESFYIETIYDGDQTGWVKVLNEVPVVTADIQEAEVYQVKKSESTPTANDDVTINEVSVVATDGAVIIKGAEGKTVVITNVLGQQVANTVISSNEATIAAPAGVVVVAVEGEEAVKAIVK